MDILQPLSKIAQPTNQMRREGLLDTLADMGLEYVIQSGEGMAEPMQDGALFRKAPARTQPVQLQNIIVPIGQGSSRIVLGAHYDTCEGSCGANDNAAAVCILLATAKTLSAQNNLCADVVFFDAEETGQGGSRLYIEEKGRQNIPCMVNLDICGYGDTLLVRRRKNCTLFRPFFTSERLNKYRAKQVKYLPDGDDISFSQQRIPALSIAVMPKWDAAFLPSLDQYAGSWFGIPRELREQLSVLEIMTTLHGGERDRIECIERGAVQLVYDYLMDTLLSL